MLASLTPEAGVTTRKLVIAGVVVAVLVVVMAVAAVLLAARFAGR